jgi:hypothetical protein
MPELRSCPSSFIARSPDHPRAPQPALPFWPSAAQLAPRRLQLLTGGSHPSSPTLGRSPTGAGTPTLSRLCSRAWPQARTPRGAPSGPIKRAAGLHVAFPLETPNPRASRRAANPSRAAAMDPLRRRFPVAVKEPQRTASS